MITTKREALVRMAEVTSQKLASLAAAGEYSDSDYDVLENYLTITSSLLSADYEGEGSYMPTPSEAPWCPREVVDFLFQYRPGPQR